MKKEDIPAKARKYLRQAIDAERFNRECALEDLKFENGDQWVDAVKREREEDGRPCLVINKTAGVVKQIVGTARQNRFGIKVRPVDDQTDPKTAEVLTGLIRNIENVSDAENAYDTAVESAVRCGFGYFRILTQYASEDSFDQEICIERVVNPFSIYYDPEARKADKSDAKWCLVVEEMSAEEFARQYPEAEKSCALESGAGQDDDGWFSDETVRVAELFVVRPVKRTILYIAPPEGYPPEVALTLPAEVQQLVGKTVFEDELQEGLPEALREIGFVQRERESECRKIEWYKITGKDVLEGPVEVPGKYIPIIPVLGEEVWIEGKPHYRSAIRFAKDPARLYNWARSTAVETISLAPKQPFIGTLKAIEGHESQWFSAHRKAQGILLYNDGEEPPSRQPSSIPDSGALNEAMQAADDIKATTGIYDASMGAQGNETSGRAIIARQRQGDAATFVFTDNLNRSMRHCGRVLVDMIPKIYDRQRVVRLLNEDGSDGWAMINATNPDGSKVNDISVGKYDVVVTTGPNYLSKRLEAADGMVQLVTAAPQFAPVIIPRVAKNLDWPESDQIAEEMRAMMQPQPNPEQQMALTKDQLDIEGKQLVNAKRQQDLAQDTIQHDQKMYEIAMQAISDTLRQLGYGG